METFLSVLVIITLIAVLIVLGTGLVSFIVGGEFNRKYANKLMQLRVATQACAVLLLLAILLLRHFRHVG
jgi:hypothetical protein